MAEMDAPDVSNKTLCRQTLNDNLFLYQQWKIRYLQQSIGRYFRAPIFQIPRRGRNGPVPAESPARKVHATAEQLLL